MIKKNLVMYIVPTVLVLLLGSYFTFFYRGDNPYPKVNSLYDYEEFHMKIADEILARHSDCYVNNNQRNDIEGRTRSCVIALLTFYENRGEDKYIDQAIKVLEKMYTQVGDSNGDGYLDFRGYYVHDNDHTVHVDGFIAQMFSHAIDVIRDNKLTKYYDVADKYEDLVDNNMIPFILNYWKEYEAEGIEYGYFISRLSDRTNTAIPYNQGAPAANAILLRGLATENKQWINIAQRYINRFYLNEVNHYTGDIAVFNHETQQRENQTVDVDYITAKYYLYDERSGEDFFTNVWQGDTDMNHLNIEFELLLTGIENGMITNDQFDLITNAFRIMRHVGKVGERNTVVFYENMRPPRRMFIDEIHTNKFQQTGYIYNVMRVGIKAPDLVNDFEEVLWNLENDGRRAGDFYSSIYKCFDDPRYDYLEFCSGDSRTWMYRIEDMSVLNGIANLGRYQ